MRTSAELFASAWCALDAELDWPALGRAHCHEGGDDFFSPEQRTAIFETGLLFADDLSAVLDHGGRSLYVGASIAEIAPILCESIVLEREVFWHNLPGPITDELNRGLEHVSSLIDVQLPRITTTGLDAVARESCDHAWLVSVLTDPEQFPALHDALYERTGDLATGSGELSFDEAQARTLIDSVLDRLKLPSTLTTTTEELRVIKPATRARYWRLTIPEAARLSGVVGDQVRVCRLWFPEY